jgi:hypothetical protein
VRRVSRDTTITRFLVSAYSPRHNGFVGRSALFDVGSPTSARSRELKMNSCLTAALRPSEADDRGTPTLEDGLCGRMRTFLRALSQSSHLLERRYERRYPYPRLIRIFPARGLGYSPAGQPLVAVGKHVSEGGIGFFHSTLLPYRRVIVELDGCNAEPLAILTDLTWCRFGKYGWYENGGRFLQLVVRHENSEIFVPTENVT